MNEISSETDFINFNATIKGNYIIISNCKIKYDIIISDLLINELYINNNIENYSLDNNVILFKNTTFENSVEILLNYNKNNLRFKNCKFNENILIYNSSSSITFIETYFENLTEINLNNNNNNISFKNTHFNNAVTVTNMNGEGIILFQNPTFKDVLIFNKCLIDSTILFNKPQIDMIHLNNDIIFHDSTFEKCIFGHFSFDKDLIFRNTEFKNDVIFVESFFLGRIAFESYTGFGKTKFSENLYFENCTINKMNFNYIIIDTTISLNKNTIEFIDMKDTIIRNGSILMDSTEFKKVSNESTARLLKSESIKSSNTSLAYFFKSVELNFHYNSKMLTYKNISEITVLFFNKWSNKFGMSWTRGVIFTVIVWILFFSITVMCRDGIGTNFIWTNQQYLQESFRYLIIYNNIELLNSNFNLAEFLFFILGKIFISYGIFQTISAFRKYGKL